MSLVWENLCYQQPETPIAKIWKSLCGCFYKKKIKPILENLNGSVELGQLTALMGPSGAGKSTLLGCITGGKTTPGFDGRILVRTDITVRACFITQNVYDHLFMNLTVAETLMYACKLKNTTKNVNHKNIIDDLLLKLNLEGTRNNFLIKCSDGEKKRLAIGLELTSVEKPNFLILDEPTSGLDSYAGLQVVELLKNLTRDNQMAIVTTIHQPSFKMLSLFDNVYILTKGGKCVYTGHPGRLAPAIRNIDANRISPHENPGDAIIEIAMGDKREGGSDSERKELITDGRLIEICQQMAGKHAEDVRRAGSRRGAGYREVQETGLCKNSANFGFKNLWDLWLRTFYTSIVRQKKFILIRFALHAIVAVVLAALYDRGIGLEDGCFFLDPAFDTHNCSCVETEERIREESVTSKNVKFQFFSLLFLMFAALMPTVLTFPSEIRVFLNEHRNGWYTTFGYYFSKTIAEIPLQFLFPFCYTYFLYWYSQQVGTDIQWYVSWRFTYFLGVTMVCCFIAQGLGFLIGILCVKSFNITIIVSSSILLFLFLFSGFFVKTNQMAPSVSWITYFSFIKFSFESLLIILYGFGRCGLTPDTAATRPVVLFTFELKDSDLTINWVWMCIHLIGLRFLAFLILKIRADPKCKPSCIGNCTARQTIAEAVDSVSPAIGRVCRLFGTVLFLLIKWSLIIFAAQLVLGIIIIIVQEF